MAQVTVEQALGLALQHYSAGRFAQAAEVCRSVLHVHPNRADAWTNLGECLRADGRLNEAIDAYHRAIALDNQLPQAHNNLGIVLAQQGSFTQAEQAFRRAITLAPGYANAHNNLGNVCQTRGEIAAAIEAHRIAMELQPDDPSAHSNLLADLAYDDATTAEQWFDEQQRWAARHGKSVAYDTIPRRSIDRKPIRIGFVSPDLRRHSVAYFLSPLFDRYDRARFEFHCYADVIAPDDVTHWFADRCKQLRLTVGVPDSALRDIIRQDEIDVLIDLAGHTAHNRMTLFAQRAAPVQMTYLGYPSTTGVGAIDYRLTDLLADPVGSSESLHTEKLLRLAPSAWCYRPPVDAPEVSPSPAGENGFVTFGSFNNLSKLSATTVALWSNVLRAVPDSRLTLKCAPFDDPDIRRRVIDRFASQGVAPGRITLLKRDPTTRDHLAQYALIDIALDTFPYCGTTTTCEALHMGVPVITLAGDEHRSRVGASLLSTAGLEGMIAISKDAFINIATALASDIHQLIARRPLLRNHLATSSLRNETHFARVFEQCVETTISNQKTY